MASISEEAEETLTEELKHGENEMFFESTGQLRWNWLEVPSYYLY